MPGNGVIMFPIDAKAIVEAILTGVIGLLVFYAIFCTPGRPKTGIELALDENRRLKKTNKHLHGLYRNLENADISLHWELKVSQVRNKESQLAQEKLNGKLVRRENQIRSMEFEHTQERKMVMGRRQK
jgi:hypothetical protein